MAQLALKYSASASNAFTDLTLKKPISELDRMFSGIQVTRHSETSKKIVTEVWRLDNKSTSIICERMGGMRLNLCTPSIRRLDISTIFKISDSNNSDNVVKMHYIDTDHSKNVEVFLSFQDEGSCLTFLKVIGYLMTKVRLTDAHERQISHVCKVFDSLDKDGNGFLSQEEIENLFPRLNIKKKAGLFEYLYNKIAIESKKGMSTTEFFKFYHTLSRLPDVEFIFVTYAYSNGSINVQQFTRFLKNEQRENRTPDEVVGIFNKLEVNINAIKGCEFTLDGFMSYMFDQSINSARNPKFLQKPHITDEKPLNYYFVKSCFVTGGSDKIEQRYVDAIADGYRHFEIEVFGVSDSKTIVVGSSRQSTSPIEFSKVLDIFNEAPSNAYPIILTLKIGFKEEHAAEFYPILSNTIVAKIQKKLCTFPEQDDGIMPTLKELIGKILIRSSIKTAKRYEGPSTTNGLQFSKLIAFDDVNISRNEKNCSQQIKGQGNDDDGEKWNTTLTFDTSMFANFSNLNETKALQTTSSYFVTVSPKNTFQNCSPTVFYNFGVQSVFMPYGVKDLNYQINQAFFEHNANCGYMLKPDDMSDAAFQSETQPDLSKGMDNISMMTGFSQFPASDLIKVSISVICGRFMPDINIKPFVYLELYGPNPMFGSTDVAEGNKDVYRISPRWNNSFEFDLPVAVYRQTILVISLYDNLTFTKKTQKIDQKPIGSFAVHISSLRPGFRNVPLYDQSGQNLSPTSILVHTKKSRAHDSSNVSSYASGIPKINNEEAFNRIVNGED